MTATELDRPIGSPVPLAFPGDTPDVDREDIRFSSPEPGRLAVDVRFRNSSEQPLGRSFALLQSAPLGAFLPWTPLGVLLVPELDPGEEAIVTQDVAVEPPAVLGGIDKLPPDRLLVALGLGEPDRSRRRRTVQPAPATDLMALVGLGSAHWAGNLNIFFPGKDVERHVAQALRVYPGRVNLAMFIVGTGTADRYKFELSGDAAAWKGRLFDTLFGRPVVDGAKSDPVGEGKWHRPQTGMFLLAVEPPADAATGAVNVHVRQKSSGREAVVEFTLDATAAGPGCYKL